MIDYRYDTQLLIEGTGLDEDAINDYFRTNFQGDACSPSVMMSSSRSTTTPMSLGRCSNTAPRSAKFSIS